jgi:hypothetical protein
MAKGGSSYKIKLSSGMKPYVGRVVRNGRIQRAFAERIGRPVGQCVKSGVSKGMGAGAIKDVVRDCAKRLGRVPLGGIGRRYGGDEG